MRYKKTIAFENGIVQAKVVDLKNNQTIDKESFYTENCSLLTYLFRGLEKQRKEQFSIANRWADKLIIDLNDLVVE